VQRGVAGIDGLVAGAAGVHRATGRPTALVLGDVSFLHDVAALQVAPLDGPPFVVLVLDNDGGRIFEQLPVARHAPEAMPHFLTPPRLRVDAAAAAFGVRHVAVRTVAACRAALADALATPGTTIVQAGVPPHGALAMLEPLWAHAATVVQALRE
jgi:2-succinyl-5-enolpyruvyl-6-hydroxy-3-cyclohexene-1-carboxylate synthase